jgi:hypothetical protein
MVVATGLGEVEAGVVGGEGEGFEACGFDVAQACLRGVLPAAMAQHRWVALDRMPREERIAEGDGNQLVIGKTLASKNWKTRCLVVSTVAM